MYGFLGADLLVPTSSSDLNLLWKTVKGFVETGAGDSGSYGHMQQLQVSLINGSASAEVTN